MKQLQKDYTTPEQSKRLLELGLPADSADCGIIQDDTISTKHFGNVPNVNVSWSVGRLIEIELICREPQEGMIPRLSFIHGDSSEYGLNSENLIESLIAYLESGQYKYDFSKLEDRK